MPITFQNTLKRIYGQTTLLHRKQFLLTVFTKYKLFSLSSGIILEGKNQKHFHGSLSYPSIPHQTFILNQENKKITTICNSTCKKIYYILSVMMDYQCNT